MLPGFEDITAPLTQEELDLVPVFVKGFSDKIGAEAAVTTKQIINSFAGKGKILTGPRIRKIVHYLRVKHLVRNLVASSSGYYIETDRAKILTYKESLRRREEAIRSVRDSFVEEYRAPMHVQGSLYFPENTVGRGTLSNFEKTQLREHGTLQ